MIKEIKYTGYTAIPDDYQSPDGDLAQSLDLINESGAMQPIFPPKTLMQLAPGHRLLLIHSVSGLRENLILLSSDQADNITLLWIDRQSAQSAQSTLHAVPIETKTPLTHLRDIAIIGNTLAIATSQGVSYILWRDGNYKYLGNRPPFLPISFGAYKIDELSHTSTATYDDVPPAIYSIFSNTSPGSGAYRPHGVGSPVDKTFWRQVSDQALGLLLGNVADKITSSGYIYQPFYIRYAFRLYDGSYSWHSAPVLMLVTAHRPIISVSCATKPDYKMDITCKLAVPYFAISYRLFGDLTALDDWADIITGIDIFMSSPIYTYKQDGIPGPPITRYNLYTDNLDTHTRRGRPDTTDTPDDPKILTGHYADIIQGPYTDRFVSLSKTSMQDLVWAFEASENFNDKIQHEFLFYKVASLDISRLETSDTMQQLPLIKTDLTNINTLETLPDDYNSHATIIPSFLHTYNRRLMMTDISIRPAAPLPMVSLAQAATMSSAASASLSSDATESVRIFTRVGGVKCVSSLVLQHPASTSQPPLYPFSDSFPRFIYHPDSAAYKIEITAADGKYYSIPLNPHPYLSGSYWFGGLAEIPEIPEIPEAPDDTTATSAIVSGKVYISQINNPFIFPVQSIVTIDCGRIFGISSAAKALSQGQFGQFPLYAFTDNGVWALEITSTGTVSARQPITRDVCISSGSITQIDSAVLFATRRGIMLISGSQTQCISGTINTDTPFDISSLHTSLFKNLRLIPFTDFLRYCSMIYDYIHQRIIVFSTALDIPYAYIYSLRSKQWGMIFSDISYKINSYPEALAVADDGRLISFSDTDNKENTSALLPTQIIITRPLKLDAPDTLKTIDTIIQRGHFRRGHVSSILYGSRDLFTWHTIWSGTDHHLRGFSGTPYKYFRIALICSLSPGETITGATIRYTPRLTNRPR